jgi:hypothetical protein
MDFDDMNVKQAFYSHADRTAYPIAGQGGNSPIA